MAKHTQKFLNYWEKIGEKILNYWENVFYPKVSL